MTGWKMRLAGHTDVQSDLTPEQIVEGVKEGICDPTDEVQSPTETTWTPLEMHPHFQEAMAALEPEDHITHDEEARLDMNPLIDVALVLLIFFILTTTYEEMRKELPSPPPTPKGSKAAVVSEEELFQKVVRASVTMESGQPVYRIADEVTPEDKIQDRIERAVKDSGNAKKAMAVEIGPGVPWKCFIALQDAATGAKIEETIRVVRKSQLEKKE